MAVVVSGAPSQRPVLITRVISRFRKRNAKDVPEREGHVDSHIDARPALVPSPLPLVLPEHQQALSNLGWTTITFPQPFTTVSPHSLPTSEPHPLQSAYEALLSASKTFFAQPVGEKIRWKHRLGSEEGWSSIPGEKEFITLRTLDYCPEVLREPAKIYWDLIGAHLENTMGRIARSLAIPEPYDTTKGLKQFVGACRSMQERDEQKTATMLRLFRYEGWEAKEVAEPHADLGLLSVVVGDVPGLEVWDGTMWFEVEKELVKSAMTGGTLLVGRQLERLSNRRYPAGGHRVVSYGNLKGAGNGAKRYRFSVVFVLRAHENVIIDSDELETNVTGKWSQPVRHLTAGELYAQIRGAHFNINVSREERERQKQNAERA